MSQRRGRRVIDPTRSARPAVPGMAGHGRDEPGGGGLLALGIGLAAAGAGAALGLAAERMAAGRLVGHPAEPEEDPLADPDGGPPFGSLRGEPGVVLTEDGVPLHTEVDDVDRDVRGRPVHPTAGGEPVTVVLTHGYTLTLDSWHYQRLALRGRYRLVLWDQRGHGRSGTGPAGASTIARAGADLETVIEAVAPDGPLVLIGHSMGGMTVMSLASRRPDLFADRVLGVGLISTSAGGLGELDLGLARFGRLALRATPVAARVMSRAPNLLTRGRRLGSDLESLLVRRYSFGSDVPPALQRFAAGMIAATRVEVISDYLPAFSAHDEREALAAMAGHDVLVMVGDGDQLTPVAHSEEIARLLPDADHLVVRHAGHLLMLEHPQVVNEHLLALVEHAAADAAAAARTRRRAWGRRTVTPVWRRRREDRPDPQPEGRAS